MKTIFLRVLEADDKGAALRAAIREPVAEGSQRYEVDATSFSAVPRSPFAYWVSKNLRRVFSGLPPFEGNGRTARVGLQSSDDFRFMRAWWAVPSSSVRDKWFPFVKGGVFSPFYSEVALVVHWGTEGREMKAWADPLYDNSGWSRIIKSTDFYFRPGITWPVRSIGFSPSPVPKGCIFSVRGYLATSDTDDLMWLLGLMASAPFEGLFRLGLSGERPEYVVGVLAAVPVPDASEKEKCAIATLSRRGWSLKRSRQSHAETSRAFTFPALLRGPGDNLTARIAAWTEHVHTTETELTAIHADINAKCFDLYGFDLSDRQAITEGFGGTTEASDEVVEEDSEGETESGDEATLVADLVAWAVGVAFGRFDLRLATDTQALPPEPGPFDPLPACCPAMLTGDGGLPVASSPAGYPVAFTENGILVDDCGHARDLTAAVRVVFEQVFKASADAWWNEIGALLDPKDHELRTWLGSSFFEHHLKRYSKSRRKAPILWQLAVPSGRYSVWLYAHRLTRDSFFQIQNDVVTPKLDHEERQLTSLVQSAGGNPPARERKEIAAQEAFVEELRALLEEVKRVAPLWNPMLDDGVVLTIAPLWRLVPQHKPWQKELKSKWDELAVGKYDWAHLAMHLWPERVVPKCATDRSLAIAHGLEDVFWAEGDDGKWKPRPTPTRRIDELVRERTSVAVKAALKSLLEAPVANANGGRGRRRRAANAASDGGAD
jgi:hypothetical protein